MVGRPVGTVGRASYRSSIPSLEYRDRISRSLSQRPTAGDHGRGWAASLSADIGLCASCGQAALRYVARTEPRRSRRSAAAGAARSITGSVRRLGRSGRRRAPVGAPGESGSWMDAAKSRKPGWPGSDRRQSSTSRRALSRSPRWAARRACRNVRSGPPSAGWPVSRSRRSSASVSTSRSISAPCHLASARARSSLASGSPARRRISSPVANSVRARRGSGQRSRPTCRAPAASQPPPRRATSLSR